MVEVNAVIHEKHYVTHLNTANNSLTADESIAHGGSGEGFNPEQLLAASLASCTSITLRMYADRKGFAVEKIDVTVTLVRHAELKTTDIERQITITGALTEEQKNRMLEIANSCPIHKILSNPINIKTELK